MPEAVSPPQRIPPPVEVHVPQQQEQVVNAHCSQSPVKHSAVMNGGGSGHGGGPGPEVQPVVKQEKTESDAPAPTSTEDRKQSDTPVPAICPTEGKSVGCVKWFNCKRNFGFIKITMRAGATAEEDEEDVFLHGSSIMKKNPRRYGRTVDEGEIVEFDLVESNKGREAIHVTGLGGQAVKGSRYDAYRFPRRYRYPRQSQPLQPRNVNGEDGGDNRDTGADSSDHQSSPGTGTESDQQNGQGQRRTRKRRPRQRKPNGADGADKNQSVPSQDAVEKDKDEDKENVEKKSTVSKSQRQGPPQDQRQQKGDQRFRRDGRRGQYGGRPYRGSMYGFPPGAGVVYYMEPRGARSMQRRYRRGGQGSSPFPRRRVQRGEEGYFQRNERVDFSQPQRGQRQRPRQEQRNDTRSKPHRNGQVGGRPEDRQNGGPPMANGIQKADTNDRYPNSETRISGRNTASNGPLNSAMTHISSSLHLPAPEL